MVLVPLAFHKCIVDDTRLLLSSDVSDDGPSSQHTRLLQVMMVQLIFQLCVCSYDCAIIHSARACA